MMMMMVDNDDDDDDDDEKIGQGDDEGDGVDKSSSAAQSIATLIRQGLEVHSTFHTSFSEFIQFIGLKQPRKRKND